MHLARGDVPLFLHTITFSKPIQLRLLSKDNGGRYVTENIAAEFERDVEHAFVKIPEPYGPHCIGLVNGIVCLEKGRNHVAFWNPATREIKDVYVCPVTTDYEEGKAFTNIVGFGFDSQSNDFKLLRQNGTRTSDNGSDDTGYTIEFHMYSLKADSWKRIKDSSMKNNRLITSTTGAYFNSGVNYWTAFERGELRHPAGIVSFNFSSEIFKEFELPGAVTQVGCCSRIGKYKEGLALFVERALGTKETSFEIWAVTKFRDDDNEVPSSWQLVVKVPPIYVANHLRMESIFDCGDILLSICRPKAHWVVEGDGTFTKFGAYMYNQSTRTFNYLGFRFNSSYRYVESLFPLSKRLNHIQVTDTLDMKFLERLCLRGS